MINESSDEIALLQKWYADQCNGDWEHTFGIKVDTLDNPGWMLTVDLAETSLSGIRVERDRVVRGPLDWAQHEIADEKFIACGGPFSLNELIRRFLAVVAQHGG